MVDGTGHPHRSVASVRAVRALVVIPTVDEVANVADVLRQVRAVVPHADVLVVDGASAGRHRCGGRAVAAEPGQIEVLEEAARSGWAAPTERGFERGLARGLRGPRGDGRRPLPRPRRPAALIARRRGRRPAGHRVALRVGGLRAGLGDPPPSAVAMGQPLREPRPRPRGAGRDRGVPGVPPGTLRDIGVSSTAPTAAASRSRWPYRVARTGGGIVELPITFHDRVRARRRCRSRIVVEAMLLVTWWAIRDRIFRRRPCALTAREGAGRVRPRPRWAPGARPRGRPAVPRRVARRRVPRRRPLLRALRLPDHVAPPRRVGRAGGIDPPRPSGRRRVRRLAPRGARGPRGHVHVRRDRSRSGRPRPLPRRRAGRPPQRGQLAVHHVGERLLGVVRSAFAGAPPVEHRRGGATLYLVWPGVLVGALRFGARRGGGALRSGPGCRRRAPWS